ncbi:hypothetical protein BDZ91DRAFT_411438 [Kalaharituber pfeilii]|nr:hypothetical protein BDZ91DRAFT_411438 [Kalaharituber pfeilii]
MSSEFSVGLSRLLTTQIKFCRNRGIMDSTAILASPQIKPAPPAIQTEPPKPSGTPTTPYSTPAPNNSNPSAVEKAKSPEEPCRQSPLLQHHPVPEHLLRDYDSDLDNTSDHSYNSNMEYDSEYDSGWEFWDYESDERPSGDSAGQESRKTEDPEANIA